MKLLEIPIVATSLMSLGFLLGLEKCGIEGVKT